MIKDRSSSASDRRIVEAIRQIANHGKGNKLRSPYSQYSNLYAGYVEKINKGEEVTVDVREYVFVEDDDEKEEIGLHKDVRLSALPDNTTGLLTIPKYKSDVIVAVNAEGEEFVILNSDVDLIQLDSHETVSIGVKEREKYDEEDDTKEDVNKLKETGLHSSTVFNKDSVSTMVEDKQSKTSQTITSTSISQSVNGKSTFNLNEQGISAVHDKSSLNIGADKSSLSSGSSSVSVKEDGVYVGGENNVEPAVLGLQLADILSEIVTCISQATTTTQLGPQPIINASQFISLSAKIKSFRSTSSGFLTKKVKVKK